MGELLRLERPSMYCAGCGRDRTDDELHIEPCSCPECGVSLCVARPDYFGFAPFTAVGPAGETETFYHRKGAA